MTDTPTFAVWIHMRERCSNPNHASWDRYGGRGIVVCRRWLDSYEAFLHDMGPRPSAGHSIDRIDNDGDYEPGNCRWATAKQQARNRSSSRFITAFGETLCLAEWASRAGLRKQTLAARLDRGIDAETAIATPLRAPLK